MKKYKNDMTTFQIKDDVLTLLVHLGYLTYDKRNGTVLIPNQEITQEFMRAVKVGGWDGLIQSLEHSEDLLRATWHSKCERGYRRYLVSRSELL